MSLTPDLLEARLSGLSQNKVITSGYFYSSLSLLEIGRIYWVHSRRGATRTSTNKSVWRISVPRLLVPTVFTECYGCELTSSSR